MTDPDRNRQREHWQAIAEQLGLAPEEELSAEKAGPRETPAAKAAPAPPAPPTEPEAEAATAKAAAPKQLEPTGEVQVEEKQALEQAEPSMGGDQTAKPVASEPALEEAAMARRGQRRRQTRETQALESGGDEPVPGPSGFAESAPSEEMGGQPSRRGRVRGRHKKSSTGRTQATPAGETETKPQEVEPAGQEDADAEDLSSLRSWNVPSWNELIASLYRPER